jgi:hypothetical protein
MDNQPREYEIVHFEKSDFQDQNGNYWCNVLFKGAASEPIKIVVKDPTDSVFSVGSILYGRITNETSKAGKPYNRFRREKKPDAPTTLGNDGSTGNSQGWKSNDAGTQESIARSVALKAAVDSHSSGKVDDILKTAETYLAWLQGGAVQKPVETVHNEPLPSEPPDLGGMPFEGSEIPFD